MLNLYSTKVLVHQGEISSYKICSEGSRKISPGKITTHQTPPWKIPPPPRKFPPGIFPPISLSFFTLSSLNTSSISGGGEENVHKNSPRTNILRFWKFWYLQNSSMFHLRKNSNNQHILMSSNKFPSWNLSFVNIEYYQSASQQVMSCKPTRQQLQVSHCKPMN